MEKQKPLVIAIKPDVKKGLDDLKVHPRETYSQVIKRIIAEVHKIQYVDTAMTEAEIDKEFRNEEEVGKEIDEIIKKHPEVTIIQDSEKPKTTEPPNPENIPDPND